MEQTAYNASIGLDKTKNGQGFIRFTNSLNQEFAKIYLTDELLRVLAIHMPRMANERARQIKQPKNADIDVSMDVVEAAGIHLTDDMVRDQVQMRVDDDLGYQCAWRLTLPLARSVGQELLALADRLEASRPKPS